MMIKNRTQLSILFWLFFSIFTFSNVYSNADIVNKNQDKKSVIKTENDNTNLAPDFTLKDIQDKDVKLSDFKGKVIILNFWATWCPPCRMEIPDLKKLYNFYKDKGLVIIGIAIDEDGKDSVVPFVKENKINYPILIGNMGVYRLYGGIRGVPTTFIINRQRKIVNTLVGYRDLRTFEYEIKKLL